MTSISRDEWLRALEQAGHSLENDPSAITTDEFAEMFGLTRHTAARRLDLLVKSGQALQTRRVGRTRDGKQCSLIAYRLIDANPKTKKRKPS